MNALVILVPLSILMGLVGLIAFFWSARKGQFDDPEGNAWRVIVNDAQPAPEREKAPAPSPGRGA